MKQIKILTLLTIISCNQSPTSIKQKHNHEKMDPKIFYEYGIVENYLKVSKQDFEDLILLICGLENFPHENKQSDEYIFAELKLCGEQKGGKEISPVLISKTEIFHAIVNAYTKYFITTYPNIKIISLNNSSAELQFFIAFLLVKYPEKSGTLLNLMNSYIQRTITFKDHSFISISELLGYFNKKNCKIDMRNFRQCQRDKRIDIPFLGIATFL